MELRQLAMFVAVADHMHFGRAAKSCYIAQSALSQQIVRLERSLGVKLFNRTSRKVELTDSGRVLLVDARTMLAASEQAIERVRRAADPVNFPLTVAICGLCPAQVGTRAVRSCDLFHRRSAVEIRYCGVNAARDLWRRGHIDVLLSYVQLDLQAPVVESVLCEHPRLLAAHDDHPLARRDAIEVAHLAGEVVVGLLDCIPGATSKPKLPETTNFDEQAPGLRSAEFIEDVFTAAAMQQAVGIVPASARPLANGFDNVKTVPMKSPPAKLLLYRRHEPSGDALIPEVGFNGVYGNDMALLPSLLSAPTSSRSLRRPARSPAADDEPLRCTRSLQGAVSAEHP